jgi:glycosyltransferase involved in cell wall biosynthesis
MAFFSVIIPLYNKENFIENTLKSILNQNFADFELIIVNDGSTDKSEEKIFGFNDSRIHYYSKENGGVSSARNYGIEKAKSNYITFIDADDFWYPNFLKEMHKNINKHPEFKVFSAAIEVETAKKVIPSNYSILKTGDCEIVNYFEASSKESVIWTSCAVFHKSVFEEVGNFDIKIKISEDTDLWIRVGLNYKILFSWKILARYCYDSNSVSRNLKYIMEESTFLKYSIEEKKNKPLKKFLDLNRFSMAIKCKLIGDHNRFKNYYAEIHYKNVGLKKMILLNLPSFILFKLIKLKSFSTNLGLGNSVFK